MIILKRINRKNSTISCEAYVEDCNIPVMLSLDRRTNQFTSGELPDGYDYCTAHLRHAKAFLSKLDMSQQLPREQLIMWY